MDKRLQGATGIPARGNSPGTRASKPAGRRAGAWAAACATHPLRTKSPRSRKCPAASTAPGNAGFQARLPSRKPLASPCACPLRGVAFCSGTPPRSGGGSGKGCGAHSRRRGKPRRYRRRMPRRHGFCSGTPPRSEGGGKGCGGRSRSAREAAPLQKAGCRAAKRPIRNPRSPIRNSSPLPIGAGSRAATKRRTHRRAEAESTNPRFSPPSRAVRAPDLAHGQAPARCHGHPCPWEFPGNAGFQARRPKGRRMGRGMRHAPAAD